jgi:hypothetical protein
MLILQIAGGILLAIAALWALKAVLWVCAEFVELWEHRGGEEAQAQRIQAWSNKREQRQRQEQADAESEMLLFSCIRWVFYTVGRVVRLMGNDVLKGA